MVFNDFMVYVNYGSSFLIILIWTTKWALIRDKKKYEQLFKKKEKKWEMNYANDSVDLIKNLQKKKKMF